MPYEYSDTSRAADPHALPDVEVFRVTLGTPPDECPACNADADAWDRNSGESGEHNEACIGFYYAFGFPGCMWDGEPSGPYATEAEALAAARESTGCCAHGIPDGDECEECPPPTLWVLATPDQLRAVGCPCPPLPTQLTDDWTSAAAWCSREAAEGSAAHFASLGTLHAVKLDDETARKWGAK